MWEEKPNRSPSVPCCKQGKSVCQVQGLFTHHTIDTMWTVLLLPLSPPHLHLLETVESSTTVQRSTLLVVVPLSPPHLQLLETVESSTTVQRSTLLVVVPLSPPHLHLLETVESSITGQRSACWYHSALPISIWLRQWSHLSLDRDQLAGTTQPSPSPFA